MRRTPGFSSLAQWVSHSTSLHPEAPAIWYRGKTISYAELDYRSGILSKLLIDQGVRGKTAGICLGRTPELFISILAILKAGGLYVPFDPEYPSERLEFMIRESAVPVIISSDPFSAKLPKGNFKIISPDSQLPDKVKPGKNYDINSPGGYILFTSGSTGQPKGVVMHEEALVNLVDWQIRNTEVHTGGKTLQFAPVSFDVSFQEIFSTWCDGGTLYLISEDERLNPDLLIEFLSEQKINRLYLPFIALQGLASAGINADLTELKEIITAGEQLQVTPALKKFFNKIPHCKLYNHYGPTETHVVSSYLLKGNADDWEALPPIGKPISGAQLLVLDDKLNRLKPGETGDLYLSGICLAEGYLNRPDLTSERFIASPFNPNARMYKTGDLAIELPDGNFQYLGRSDGQVKIRGYRIEPGEIEIAIAEFPSVTECAVIVREDIPGEKKLVGYVSASDKIKLKELRAHIRKSLPEYMMPSAIVFLDQLPRTPSGKTDRKNLPAPGNSRPDTGIPYEPPVTSLQKKIADVWSTLLGFSPLGITDNFFDNGGNSLLALQSISKIKADTGLRIPVVSIYQYPTVRELSASLENSGEEETEQIVVIRDRESEDIAIIGMSLKFPGAETPEEFWNNLKNGVESLTFFKPEDIDPSVPDELKNDPNYVRARGLIKDPEGFDASFFNISPAVAKVTDPQQRIFLQLAWNALENSGYSPERYKGLIGVFAGTGNNTYFLNNVLPNPDAVSKVGSFLTMTQNEKDYIATRVAYELNLKGVAVSVHTGCSTSLTAVVQAFQSLRDHQCDMALAGGVAITCPVNSGQLYEEGAMFSPDGHTRPFDKNARGTAFSDGAGIVVLKRLKDAVRDQDTIYAVIKGAALNNDGGNKGSFTAPSVEGQSSVIRMAQNIAGVKPSEISYVETHGTATPLGDPIEIEGLRKAFRKSSDEKYCAIGSVKSNFGHLTSAAGVAGLIKTALALYYKELPATLHYTESNPQINFEDSPFYVNAKHKAWKTDLLPRRAGVSSFGVGGTNAHVVLEEAPLRPVPEHGKPENIFILSAKSEKALSERKRLLAEYITRQKNIIADEASWTLQDGRTAMQYRYFATASSLEQLVNILQNDDPKKSSSGLLKQKASGVAFMFPGQGSQYPGMGSALYAEEPAFHAAVEYCAEIYSALTGVDIRKIIFTEESNESIELLRQTKYTQPAVFIIGYALSELWISRGVSPSVLVGHSIGEFVAAAVSGIMSVSDALKLVSERGRLMQELPGGSMLSVRVSADEIASQLPMEVSIAAINGPKLCVVAGPHHSIEQLQKKWEAENIICKGLHTSHAFHSPMMDPVIEPFKEIVKTIKLNAPSVPVMSTVTNQWITAEEAVNPEYWANHLRATVKFAGGIKECWKQNPGLIFLELGPRNTATTLARQQSSDPAIQKAFPSLGDSPVNELQTFNYATGQLWVNGIDPDWKSLHGYRNKQRIPLPGYPFENKKYWLDPVINIPVTKSIATNSNIEQIISEEPLPIHTLTAMNKRKDRIISEIREILEDASGIEMNAANPDTAFTEAGLDSLLLTQTALTISRKYNVKVTFRQLNESLSTLNSLSEYIDKGLPAETEQPAVISNTAAPVEVETPAVQKPVFTTPPVSYNPSVANQAVAGSVQDLIQQQIALMQQQLALLTGTDIPLTHTPEKVSSLTPSQPAPVQQIIPSAPVSVSKDETEELKKPFGAIARIEKSGKGNLTDKQLRWIEAFSKAYSVKTKKSKEYTGKYRGVLADPRVVTGFRPHLKEMIYQPVVNKSEGSKIWDIDGNEYVDILNGFGSNMFGHNPPFIVKALQDQLKRGYELGPQHELAGEVAEMICEFTGFDRAGFCNTGSEAVLGAMRIARTVTGRSIIVSFNGSYHGINDEVILRGTKKHKPVPAAAGILPEAVQNMIVLDYGTTEALDVIRKMGNDIAAVLVEPVQSRRADFHPQSFLHELRKITAQSGTLLIFDEVITGFRVLPGGAQEFFGIKADLGTYGKVVGGGMPIGVIAGKKEYMDALDGGHWEFGDASVPEVGVTYFAGTFVRHPFALAAAKASLLHMKELGHQLQQNLNQLTAKLVSEINNFSKFNSIPFHLVSFGSLFKPKYETDLPNADLLYLLLRYKGVHVYDGFPCFLTEAHTVEDVDFIVKQFRDSLTELVTAGFIPGNISGSTVSFNNGNGYTRNGVNPPPVPGALNGKNPDGSEGWFLPDPERPGKYVKIRLN